MSGFTPLDVRHCDLGESWPETLHGVSGRGVYLVWWQRQRPLAHCLIAASELPMTGNHLATIAAPRITHTLFADLDGPEPGWYPGEVREARSHSIDWPEILRTQP